MFEQVIEETKKLGSALDSIAKGDKTPMEQIISRLGELRKDYEQDPYILPIIEEIITLAKREVERHV